MNGGGASEVETIESGGSCWPNFVSELTNFKFKSLQGEYGGGASNSGEYALSGEFPGTSGNGVGAREVWWCMGWLGEAGRGGAGGESGEYALSGEFLGTSGNGRSFPS